MGLVKSKDRFPTVNSHLRLSHLILADPDLSHLSLKAFRNIEIYDINLVRPIHDRMCRRKEIIFPVRLVRF